MEFYSGGRNGTQLLIQHGQVEICRVGGSVDGKLLRENRAKGSSGEINLAGFLLKKSQDN